jgi:hypothetical protein
MTSERISSSFGTLGAYEEPPAKDVGQLDRLVGDRLRVEHLVGELAPAAERRQPHLGARDLAVVLGPVAAQQG